MSSGHECPLNDWVVATTSACAQEPGDHVGPGSVSTGVERGSVLPRGLAWNGTEGLCSPAWAQEDPSSRALGAVWQDRTLLHRASAGCGGPLESLPDWWPIHLLPWDPVQALPSHTFCIDPAPESAGNIPGMTLHRTHARTTQNLLEGGSEASSTPGIPTSLPGRDQGADPLSWARLSVFSNFSSRYVWCFEINTGLKH